MKTTKFAFTFPPQTSPIEIAQLAGKAEMFVQLFPVDCEVSFNPDSSRSCFIVEVTDDQEGRPEAIFNALVTYIAGLRGVPLSAGEITRSADIEAAAGRLLQSERLDEAIYTLETAREGAWGETSDQIGCAISLLKLIREVKA